MSDKANEVITGFSNAFKYAISTKLSTVPSASISDFSTRLRFVGYDPDRQQFVGTFYLFTMTNTNFATSSQTDLPIGDAIGEVRGVVGSTEETAVLGNVFDNDPSVNGLLSDDFKKKLEELRTTETRDMTDKRLIDFFLVCFKLQKDYKQESRGTVGEPYVICEITKDKCVQIH